METNNNYIAQCLSCQKWGQRKQMTHYDAERVTFEDNSTMNYPDGWVHNSCLEIGKQGGEDLEGNENLSILRRESL